MVELQLAVTSTDLRQAYVDLKSAAKELMPELRKGMKAAAKPLVDSIKREAGFSGRIPGATSAKVSFSAKSAGLSVKVDAKKAPEARPLNNRGRAGTFRHPVYADAARESRNEWTWVAQPANPFWARGIKNSDRGIDKAMADVLDSVARKAGFK